MVSRRLEWRNCGKVGTLDLKSFIVMLWQFTSTAHVRVSTGATSSATSSGRGQANALRGGGAASNDAAAASGETGVSTKKKKKKNKTTETAKKAGPPRAYKSMTREQLKEALKAGTIPPEQVRRTSGCVRPLSHCTASTLYISIPANYPSSLLAFCAQIERLRRSAWQTVLQQNTVKIDGKKVGCRSASGNLQPQRRACRTSRMLDCAVARQAFTSCISRRSAYTLTTRIPQLAAACINRCPCLLEELLQSIACDPGKVFPRDCHVP